MSNNSSMSKFIQLVECNQFASEPLQQLTDHKLIHNKLVGEDTTLEDTLAKKYSNFKDVQSKKNTTGEIQKPKKQGEVEAAKWRGDPAAYDVDDEGNKTPKTPNKFSYDPLVHRQDTAGDAKTARGKKWALKTSIGMVKGQHGPKGYLPEQGVAESSEPTLGTVRANLMHTEKPTVQVQVFKHSYWVTKEVKKFKTMDHAQAYIDRINKQDVAEAGLKFHRGFPDVDHMRGSVIRNAEMASDNVKVKNKDEWERAVNSINAKVFDDESEFISSSKGTSVEGNGVVWAKWGNDTQSGWFNVQGNPLKSWPVQESKEAAADKKATAKIASLEKKIKDAQDALGLARERRRMKGQHQQGPREIALSSKMNALRQQIDTIKREAAQTNESEDFSELEEQLNELSTSLLGKYKTAAGKAASEADKRGDFETGHKRFKGIMKATKKQFANDSKGAKKESAELGEADGNPVDTITMDVPLMIRIMEYAREDAKTDMDLHDVAEKLIELGASGRALSMQDYSAIMSQQNEDQLNELGATNSAATLAAPGITAPVKPGTPTTTATTAPGTSPTTTPATATSAAAKPASPTTTAATPAKLNPDEQTALNKIMANAGLKGQFQQLIQKAKTVPGA